MSSEPSAASSFPKGKQRLIALGLFAAVLLINLRVLEFDWVFFDDDVNILFNPHLNGWSAESLRWAWTDVAYSGRYLPLGWMLYDGIFAFSGLNPFGYHLVGWLLSGVNAVLFFQLARVWLTEIATQMPNSSTSDSPSTTPLLFAAAAGSLFWTVHPLRAETAGWNSCLIYQLSTFFALLAAWIYLGAAFTNFRKSSRVFLLGAQLAFLASLAVYPIYLGLPVVLIMATWFRPNRSDTLPARAWLIAWLVMSAVWGGVNLVTSSSGVATGVDSVNLFEKVTVLLRMQAQLWVHQFWPAHPSPIYGVNDSFFTSSKDWIVIGGVLGCLAAVCKADLRRWRICAFWLGAALALFLPFTLKYHIVVHPSDRYVIGSLGVVAMAFASILFVTYQSRRSATVIAVITVLAAMLVVYERNLSHWKNTDTLLSRVDEVAEGLDPELAYGMSAERRWFTGFREAAFQRLAEGGQKFPNDSQITAVKQSLLAKEKESQENPAYRGVGSPLAIRHCEWGRYALNKHDSARASAHFQEALRLWPEFPMAAAGLIKAQSAN